MVVVLWAFRGRFWRRFHGVFCVSHLGLDGDMHSGVFMGNLKNFGGHFRVSMGQTSKRVSGHV
jgi:hypothetical protein